MSWYTDELRKMKTNVVHITDISSSALSDAEKIQIHVGYLRPRLNDMPDDFNSFFVNKLQKIVSNNGFYLNSETVDDTVQNNALNLRTWRKVSPIKIVNIVKNYNNSYNPDIFH